MRYALALGTFAVSEDAEWVETKLNQAGTKASPSLPTGWANQACGWVLKKDGSC